MNFDFFVDLSKEEITILKNNFGQKLNKEIAQSKKRIIQNIVTQKEIKIIDDEIPIYAYLITLNNEQFEIKNKKLFQKIEKNHCIYLEIGLGGIVFSCHLISDDNKTEFYEKFKKYPQYQFKYFHQENYDKYNYTFVSEYIIINQKNNQIFCMC